MLRDRPGPARAAALEHGDHLGVGRRHRGAAAAATPARDEGQGACGQGRSQAGNAHGDSGRAPLEAHPPNGVYPAGGPLVSSPGGGLACGVPEAPEPDFPFDAVLFDLDGTLVATDRIWVEAADRGCRRAFRELGLERDPPDGAGWMSLVGLPLDQGFRALFPDLEPEALAVVVERCLEAEREALAAGVAELLPGAREALEDLRRRGVKTAIASNCGGEYLAAMCDGLGLGALVDEAWCLDSPGVETKADMLRLALERFETRSAVMVGRSMDGPRGGARQRLAARAPRARLRAGRRAHRGGCRDRRAWTSSCRACSAANAGSRRRCASWASSTRKACLAAST